MMDILLTWAALSVSFFVTISLFWLGLMVLLAGNRRSAGTWLTGGGLMLGALFFTSHTAILGRGLSSTSLGMDFWWSVSWIPAVIAPLAWYGAMLWYSGYLFRQPHRHHGGLALVVILTVCIALLLVFANPLPSYQHVAGRSLALTPSLGGIPILILAYLVDLLLCYLLPLDLLRRSPVMTLEMQTRNQARPYLIGASLAMLLAGSLLALTALWALGTQPFASLADPVVARTVLRFDLAVEILVAAAVTLLGRTIVGFEVFTGRPLPRSRFFLEWRSTLLLAAGFGAVTAWMLVIELRPVYSLMLATSLMTLFYALSSWRSFDEREKYMARLRPFIASQNLYEQMTRSGDGPGTNDPSAGAYPLFETLCRKVLEVRSAVLQPGGALAALAGPALFYPPDSLAYLPGPILTPDHFQTNAHCVPVREIGLPEAEQQGLQWAVPLWSSRGLDGVLFLGQKANQNPFTEEEIEIAQTAGERLLDLLAGGEMARLSMELLRQRLAQTKILEGQGRRVLHDEVLPQLHTALLYLSGSPDPSPEQRQAMAMLTELHQRIAGLMREMPLAAPQRLSQNGLDGRPARPGRKRIRRAFRTGGMDHPGAGRAACRAASAVCQRGDLFCRPGTGAQFGRTRQG